MTIVAIGSIGTTNLTEVKYCFADGKSYLTRYALEAMLRYYKDHQIEFDRTFVLLTQEARDKNWKDMETALKNYSREVQDVDIPNGTIEDELWQMFERITSVIPEKAEIYIDITNGLRHLPMSLLIACTYLRTTKNVIIKSISYGAFDVGKRENREINGKTISAVVECPVIEMLPFVTLFDWSEAAKSFERTGDASVLAGLLRDTNTSLSDTEKEPINRVADGLDHVTLAIDLARPQEARKEANKLISELATNAERVSQYIRPFGLLQNLISRTFEILNPPQTSGSSDEQNLNAQQSLIRWYKNKRRYALAVLLAREWVVTRYIVDGVATTKPKQKKSAPANPILKKRKVAADTLASDKKSRLQKLWENLREVRNDIAHVGQNDQPKSAKTLQDEINKVLEEIEQVK